MLPAWRGAPRDRARIVRTIDAWASSDAMSRVVRAGGSDVADRTGNDLLAALDAHSVRWDARRGRERDATIAEPDPVLASTVLEAAVELGLAGRERPQRTDHDAVVMTGGMVRAGLVKPRAVRELLAHGVRTREVVFLGGMRRFSDAERGIAYALHVDGDDEWDAMCVGLARAFDLRPADAVDGVDARGGRTRAWTGDGPAFRIVAAPVSKTGRRADTAATFHHWAATAPTASSVLVVTTPVYVPYQAAVATAVLGLEHGHPVETVGTSAEASDLGAHTQPFGAAHHLQELRAAVQAMRRLRVLADRASHTY